eukprot:jgi/Phyca11/20760/fgenesh1_pg.PHYCAscaffold_72_\
MAQRGNTWTEEDEQDVKQSLYQKEAITAQMIANNRKHGLECDLRVNSDYCSKMVPPLVDTLENRGAAAAKSRAISSTTLASNQAMLERLFGPDEKTRAHTQVLKKKKMEVHKGDNRRNARGHIEKQLQASIEGHITRTVESFVYGINGGDAKSSIYMNTNLLLLHTFERIHTSHGRRNFKRFLLSELSGALFEEVFWIVFCHFYQKDSLDQQRTLADEISAKYVKMVAALRGNIDCLFRVYPYAIASGVCWGFHYLFPGSRHLYTPEFKNNVYLFYFRSPTKNSKKANFVLRTTPAADCAVGGEETFHKFYRRKPQKGYAAEAQLQQENGKKALQAYCTVLMSRKHVNEEEDAQVQESSR